MLTVHHLTTAREPDEQVLRAIGSGGVTPAPVLVVEPEPATDPAGEQTRIERVADTLRAGGLAVEVLSDVRVETAAGGPHASPLHGLAERRLHARLSSRDSAAVALLPGGLGRAPDNGPSSLGEHGSLLTACLVAASLGAQAVHHWTGGTTLRAADPDIVPDAPAIEALHVREAAEMSFYGGPVPPMRAMQPAAAAEIPITLHTTGSSTLIHSAMAPGEDPVRAVASVRDLVLMRLEGSGLARSPEMLARLFTALARVDADAVLISQGSAERSVTLAVRSADSAAAEAELKTAFRLDLSHGDVEELFIQQGVAVVAVVGLGMAASPGIAGRVFSALGQAGANVLAIAQGSSEVNISFAVRMESADAAVRGLCETFGLTGNREGDA